MEIGVVTLGEILSDPALGTSISPRQRLEDDDIAAAGNVLGERRACAGHQDVDHERQALRSSGVGDQDAVAGLQRKPGDGRPGPAGAQDAKNTATFHNRVKKNPATAMSTPTRTEKRPITGAFLRSLSLNSACSTVSVFPTSGPKLKTPRIPKPAQK